MRLVVILTLGAAPVLAQQPVTMRLAAPTATLAEEFTRIGGARELRDGRVLVSDRPEKRIVVADFAKISVEQLGRQGQGPLEYPSAEVPWPINGDSSISFFQPERWVIFAGGRLAATLGPEADAVRVVRNVIRGTDTLGHVLSGPIYPPANAQPPFADSVPLILTHRGTARVDTIIRVRTPTPKSRPFPGRPGFFIFNPPTMSMFEVGGLAPDGWLAVLRTDPYRVDWRSPDGKWVKGAPIRFPAIAVTEREKQYYLDTNPDPDNPGRTTASITDWPATIPAVGNVRQLLVAPDGRVLIPRYPSADRKEERYDIVNRRSTVDGQLVMGAGERIVGIGAKSVYVAYADSDGIQTLRRYAWPPAPSK